MEIRLAARWSFFVRSSSTIKRQDVRSSTQHLPEFDKCRFKLLKRFTKPPEPVASKHSSDLTVSLKRIRMCHRVPSC